MVFLQGNVLLGEILVKHLDKEYTMLLENVDIKFNCSWFFHQYYDFCLQIVMISSILG